MKQQWLMWLERIDALSLRERVILFFSVIVCAVAVADFVWFTPTQAAFKQLTQRFASQNAELSRLRDELRVVGTPVDPSKVVRDELAGVQAKLGTLDEQIKALVPMAQGGPALEQVLVQLLRRQDGLTLLGVSTAKAEAALAGAASPGAGTGALVGAASGAMPTGLMRRGLELRLQGPYPQLVAYVKALEVALPSLRWGVMDLKADQQPPELSLQIFVLGVQP